MASKFTTTVKGCTGQVIIGDNATLTVERGSGSSLQVSSGPVQEQAPEASTKDQIHCQESTGDDIVLKVKKGYVLVLHNNMFPGRSDVERIGSKEDMKNLKDLFDNFGFRYQIRENLSAEEMDKELAETSEKDFSKYDCFFCIIMSHGSNDVIYGTDEKRLHLEAITKKFRRDECPSLEGKPKVFLIQACRGTQQDMLPVESDSELVTMAYPRLPSDADFLICFASAPGHQSYRQPEMGSWFLSSVVTVFKEYAHCEHLMDMMLRVNHRVAQFYSKHGHKQMPCEVCMLTKKVFFDIKYQV